MATYGVNGNINAGNMGVVPGGITSTNPAYGGGNVNAGVINSTPQQSPWYSQNIYPYKQSGSIGAFNDANYYHNLNTTFEPKVSTTTISNANKINEIPKLVNTFNSISNKGITTDSNGVAKYADGSLVPETQSVDETMSDADREYLNLIEQMKASLDASTKEQIDLIQQKSARIRQEQQEINRRAARGVETSLLMGGVTGQGSSAQYAPISSQGIMQAQESYGLKQLAAIDEQENQAISQAKLAQSQGNFQLMEKNLTYIQALREKKAAATAKIQEKQQERLDAMTRDNAISALYESGITEPSKILKELRDSGINASLKEISDSVGLLSGVGGSGIVGEYNFYRAEAIKNGQVPVGFMEYQNIDANRKKSIASSSSGSSNGLTTAQFNRLNTIADNARQDSNIKDFPAVRASFETARSAASKGNGAGDIVLMRMIAKITDPTTGVREEEFKTFQSAQSTLANYGVSLTKKMWRGDRLTDAGREELLKQAKDIYSQRKSAYDNSYDYFKRQAERVGGGAQDILPYYVAPDTNSNIVSQGNDAKSSIDTFFATADKTIQNKIKQMYSVGASDITIFNYLKNNGLIN